jgi:hypothetical protein
MPAVAAKPIRTSGKPEEMLRFDLENENETIRNWSSGTRIRGCLHGMACIFADTSGRALDAHEPRMNPFGKICCVLM